MTNPAEGYESYMVPALFEPWASRLADAAAPLPNERILDLACGTGIVARQVAKRVGARRIVAIDTSPDMLDVARAAAEREGARIEWHEGRAEELPFPGEHFDLVLCQFALMFFADRSAATSEMRRVLAPGGRVILSVFQALDHHPFYQMLDDAIQRRLGASSVRDIFALGDADELRALLEGAGLQRVAVEPLSMTARFPNPEAFLTGEIEVDTASIPSMQHLDARERQALTANISQDMAEALRSVTEGDSVVLAFHVLLARAER